MEFTEERYRRLLRYFRLKKRRMKSAHPLLDAYYEDLRKLIVRTPDRLRTYLVTQVMDSIGDTDFPKTNDLKYLLKNITPAYFLRQHRHWHDALISYPPITEPERGEEKRLARRLHILYHKHRDLFISLGLALYDDEPQ